MLKSFTSVENFLDTVACSIYIEFYDRKNVVIKALDALQKPNFSIYIEPFSVIGIY